MNLSPFDGNGMPNVFPAIMDISKNLKLDYFEKDFWFMVDRAISEVREHVHNERERKREEARLKAKYGSKF